MGPDQYGNWEWLGEEVLVLFAKAIDSRFICVQANEKLTSLLPITRGEANFPCTGIPVFDNLKAGADGYIAGNGLADPSASHFIALTPKEHAAFDDTYNPDESISSNGQLTKIGLQSNRLKLNLRPKDIPVLINDPDGVLCMLRNWVVWRRKKVVASNEPLVFTLSDLYADCMTRRWGLSIPLHVPGNWRESTTVPASSPYEPQHRVYGHR